MLPPTTTTTTSASHHHTAGEGKGGRGVSVLQGDALFFICFVLQFTQTVRAYLPSDMKLINKSPLLNYDEAILEHPAEEHMLHPRRISPAEGGAADDERTFGVRATIPLILRFSRGNIIPHSFLIQEFEMNSGPPCPRQVAGVKKLDAPHMAPLICGPNRRPRRRCRLRN